MSTLTREQILERLQTEAVEIHTNRTPLFEAVPEGKMRYIVSILINGNATSQTVDIEKLEEDGTFTVKFQGVPIASADSVRIPENVDVESAILTLKGGTRLYGISSGHTLFATTIFWDNDI